MTVGRLKLFSGVFKILQRLNAFAFRFATFTFRGQFEVAQINPLTCDNEESSHYIFPLTFNKKYRVLDKTINGFIIKDDDGTLRELPWGAEHFKITNN